MNEAKLVASNNRRIVVKKRLKKRSINCVNRSMNTDNIGSPSRAVAELYYPHRLVLKGTRMRNIGSILLG